MVFCYYCSVAQRIDNIKRHCRDCHNDVARPLDVGETPLQPIIENWKIFTDDYPNAKAILNEKAEIYKKPNEDSSSVSEAE